MWLNVFDAGRHRAIRKILEEEVVAIAALERQREINRLEGRSGAQWEWAKWSG